MLPVHLAAAANSLPALRWLAEGEGCALVGTGAMTVGRPPKSVFQVTPSLSGADCTLIALSDCILMTLGRVPHLVLLLALSDCTLIAIDCVPHLVLLLALEAQAGLYLT